MSPLVVFVLVASILAGIQGVGWAAWGLFVVGLIAELYLLGQEDAG